MLELVFLVKLL